MHHVVVISDIHLCELEPHDGLWMRYRQRPFSPAPEVEKMLEHLCQEVRRDPSGSLTLVLNGDIFDFDAPRVVDGQSTFHDEPRDDAHAAPAMEAILRDCPQFVRGLARVLAAGHRVVFVSGNHDAQVTLPGVRDVLRRHILDAAAPRSDESREVLSERLAFRAWFYKTADGVLVEHGHQYDPYCSFHYPVAPFHRDTHHIQPTLGSLATRLMTSRMGYFNPHVDVTYERDALGYFQHWKQYYAFSERAIARPWMRGALRTFFSLLRSRDHGSDERRAAHVREAAEECGVDEALVEAHMALFASPIELTDRRRVARELWIDRLTGVSTSLAVAGAWLALAPAALWPVALVGAAGFAAYELSVPKSRVRDRWADVDARAKDLARLHGARAVVFGHTHHPHGRWEDGTFLANGGSWSAAYYDVECTQPVFPKRPMVWLQADGDALKGGLVAWTGRDFEPVVVTADADAEAEPTSEPGPALGWLPP
jgi:UDP-2,3-diacylglucosamine pyrophosphatase LpxH